MRTLTIKTNPRGFQKKPLIVVVGKAVSKKAVMRNLVKRRISALVRPLLPFGDRNITIIARSGAAEATNEELKLELYAQLKATRS